MTKQQIPEIPEMGIEIDGKKNDEESTRVISDIDSTLTNLFKCLRNIYLTNLKRIENETEQVCTRR